MNIVSSNINQWTILAAMIPIVLRLLPSAPYGVVGRFHFDIDQRNELALTLLQTMLGSAAREH